MSATRAMIVVATLVGGYLLLPAAAASASATVSTGQQVQIDVNPNQTNPCTGATGDLIDDERDSWTVVTRSDGSALWRGHSVARVTFAPYDTSAASYAGAETFSELETITRGAAVVQVSQRFQLHGSDGGAISFTQILHLTTTPDGTVRVDRGGMSMACTAGRGA